MIWKEIKGFEGDYEVSNSGLIRSVEAVIVKSNSRKYTRKSKTLKPAKDARGYLRVAFSICGKLTTLKVHRLVAEAYIPNPENKPQVNHKDGIKDNNNDWNLEWATQAENVDHAMKNNLFVTEADDAHRLRSVNTITKKGELNGFSKLTEKEVLEIRDLFKKKLCNKTQLGLKYGVATTTIKDIVSFKSWKYLCK